MKQFFNKLVAVLMMALATVGYSCSDCDHEPYDDTEIREQIADLYAKLAALENQISANMSAVQQMIAGRTAIQSYEQDKDGNWVLTLTDGKQITVYAEYEPEALPSSLVYVMEVEIDGVQTKVWATMGPDGQLTPIMDGANYIPVVPEEVEIPTIPTIPTLEYKVEDGKIWIKLSNSDTWIETGMTDEALDELIGQGGNNSTVAGACGITGSQFNKVKNEFDEEVVVSVTFTLSDGSTFTVKVDSDDEMSFGFYYDGSAKPVETFYLAPGATEEYLDFRTNGLVDFIKETPEGWTLTISQGMSGDYRVVLTAPTAAAIEANPAIAEGVVKLFGVFEDGTSAVLKMNVTASNPWKNFNVGGKRAQVEAYQGVYGFVYGVMKSADYDASTIKATINTQLASYSAQTITAYEGLKLDQTIEQILGAEMELGVAYTFYVATFALNQNTWKEEVTSEIVTKTVSKQVVEITQTAATYNSITVSAKLAGFNECYSVFGPKGWMSVESFVADQVNMWLGWNATPDCVYEIPNGNYTFSGAIQSLPMIDSAYGIAPGTEYDLYILPVEEGKTEYAVEEVSVCTFKSEALLAGGTGVATATITPDFTKATATINVTGAQMAYYNWYKKSEVPADLTAALLKDYYAVAEFPAPVVNSSLSAATEYVLAVLTISADGKYSEAQAFEFSTKSINYSTTFTLKATKQELDPAEAATKVSVKLETEGATVKRFYYLYKPTSQFNSSYPNDETLAKKLMGIEVDYNRQEKSPTALTDTDGCLVISGLTTGTEYTLAIIACDTEGNYTTIQKVVYTPTFNGTIIPATDARWEASKPSISFGKITPPEDEWSSTYKVEFTVTPAAGTKAWAYNIAASTYNRQENKTIYVISNAVLSAITKAETVTRSINPEMQKIYVAWSDAEGNYYEPIAFDVVVE